MTTLLPSKVPLKVLIVEDFENDAILVARALGQAGYRVRYERVETGEEMAAALARETWDVVVSDFSMPDFGAIEALRLLRTMGRAVPLFVISDHAGGENAVAAMKAGAKDFLRKDHLRQLADSVRDELAKAALNVDDTAARQLEASLYTVVAETHRLLESEEPSGVLQGHARKLHEAAQQMLALLTC